MHILYSMYICPLSTVLIYVQYVGVEAGCSLYLCRFYGNFDFFKFTYVLYQARSLQIPRHETMESQIGTHMYIHVYFSLFGHAAYGQTFGEKLVGQICSHRKLGDTTTTNVEKIGISLQI